MLLNMALMQEVDIWSYGCFIFEMLTLHVPYEGLPDSEIYDLIKVRPLHQKLAPVYFVFACCFG